MNEQALLEALLEEYAKKGYNPQAILSNSLFQRLSIDSQISLLRDNLEKLTEKPTFLRALNATKAIVPGVLAGAASALTVKGLATMANKPFTTGMGIKAGLLGASTALIPALIQAKSNLKKDYKTREHLQDNKYIQAIVGRSSAGFSQPKPISILNNMVSKATPGLVL